LTVLPYYKRYPAGFLRGIQNMTVEQIAVYTVLLEVMYDAWETVEIRTPKQRRDLAVMCGLSPRKFGTTLDELIGLDKIQRTLSGRLSNRKFELLAKDRGVITAATPEKSGKNTRDNPADNRGDNQVDTNGTNGLTPHEDGLTRARANIEPRTQNLEQSGDQAQEQAGQGTPPSEPALGETAEQIVESEISQICRAIGVDLQRDTRRHTWPARWVRMRTENNLTVRDMLAAIDSFSAQFKGEQCTSLALFKDRAIEKRAARELGDRIAGRMTATKAIEASTLTDQQWKDQLALFIRLGSWDRATFGPSPLEDGCIVPITMLDNAERYWIKNGNHPEAMHHGGTRVAWERGKAGSVREITPFFRSRAK
jgi:uncharacterized protein YdaU (DUF1376 family)